MSELRLFGARPANGVESVRAELEGYLTDGDTLVVHTPHIPTFRGALLTMLQVPAVSLGINLFALFLQLPVTLVRGRGFVWIAPSEYEAMAGDRPTHFVGDHPLERLASVGWPVILANWVLLLGSVVLDWRSTLLIVGLGLLVSAVISLNRRQGYPRLAVGLFCVGFAAGIWLLVAGYLNPLLVVGFGLGAAVTIGWANNRLLSDVLDEVATVAADHGYDEVCLVTNNMSVTTLLEKAADTDLTVGDAFAQRRQGEGHHLDADGRPRDQPLLSNTEEFREARITAQFVDWAVVGSGLVVWLLVAGLAAGAGYIEWEATVVSGVPLTYNGLFLLSMAVPPTVYYTVTEAVWGQTVGKRVRDIRVVHTDGSSPGLRAAFTRAVVGWFDFLPVGYFIGAVRMSSDHYNRRFADLAAGTIVVETAAVASGEATAHSDTATTEQNRESGGDSDPSTAETPAAESADPPASTGADQSTATSAATQGRDEDSDGRPDDDSSEGEPSAGERADAEWSVD